LPFLSSTLLTDIFAGLAVLSLHLVIFHRAELGRAEHLGLLLLIAFAAASHSATLAVLLAIMIFSIAVLLLSGARALSRLVPAGGAIAAGAVMLIAANFALSGQVAWTPGGFGIAFGRMLQDGIVKRYLDDHCPDARLKLCPYRNELPTNADDFLWSYSIFNKLGRFSGLGEEMRFIVLHSLQEYPLRQVETAVAATASQLGLVATGHGTHDRIWHTYGIIKRFIPGEVPAMQHARQQHGSCASTLSIGSTYRSRWVRCSSCLCSLRTRWFAGASMTLLALPPPPQSPCSPMPSSAARCRGRTIATVRASPGLRRSSSLSASCRRSHRSWVNAEEGLAAPSFHSVPLGCQIAAQPPRAATMVAQFKAAHETIWAKALAAMASVLRFPAPGSS
jgi:hypothetical protein